MSRKGVSFEEKKTRMLQLFYEQKEFFQLKELERIAPKEKGIIANSVKDVIQALTDDGSIDSDKIGGSVYYWSFPSKTLKIKEIKLAELKSQLETAQQTLSEINTKKQEGEDSNISDLMAELEDLEKVKEELVQELKGMKQCDPEKVKIMQNETQPLKDAANRWTDNIFSVKSWCKEKFMLEDKVLNKQFGIPEELDYIS